MAELLSKKEIEKVLSEEATVTFRILYFLFLIILGFVYQYLEFGFTNRNLFPDFIPSAVGSAMGFGIVSFIIAFVRLIKKKKPSKNIFITYFAISGIMFFFASINIINQISNFLKNIIQPYHLITSNSPSRNRLLS